ncbi:hypothetical protein ACFZCY_44045 [Streptomyces sp. NPDC007983]|uniref:hypothetical protein n=1 Tax=Streptomyces sp. NPDC007983 TaxID=3364800 RepID=UPI0036F147C7
MAFTKRWGLVQGGLNQAPAGAQLGEPEWADLLTPADRRGLTPLFWSHVCPYGEANLDMGARLKLAAATVPDTRAPINGVGPDAAGRR